MEKIKYEDVKDILAERYFTGEEFSADMFNSKYCLTKENGEKETPADVFYRVATGLSDIEKENKEYYRDEWFSLLWQGWFRPGGSILAGISAPGKQSLLNCTTLPLESDSLESISKCDYTIMKCAAFRQGIGVDASALRPKGSPINNAAVESTGVVPWIMKLVDNGKYVGQKGRMPALLISLKDHHPDIFEFITSKMKSGILENANISVQVSDKFMKAVKEDDNWELFFEFENNRYPKISRTVKAKELFDLICDTAYESAEPGVQYIDQLRNGTISHQIFRDNGDKRFEIISTNACVPDFATVLTRKGIRYLGEVNIGDEIWSGKEWTKITDKWYNGMKDVYEYNTNSSRFIGTKDHNIYNNGEKVEVGMSDGIDNCICDEERNTTFIPELVMDGLVMGDGSVHKASNDLVILYIGTDDQDYFDSEISHLITKERKKSFSCGCEIITGIHSAELPKTYDRVIPNRYIKGSTNEVCSFLRGLFSANGYVVGNRVGLKQSSLEMIKQVREMLSFVGIPCYITTNKSKCNKFRNGEYDCKISYDINISTGRKIFYDKIGFIQNYKMNKLQDTLESIRQYRKKTSYDITSVEYLGEYLVYDITVDCDDHTFWCNGSLVSNCSEKPLSPYNVCNLFSPNMEMFSSDPEEYKKEMEYVIPLIVRMADNVVSYELENNLSPLPEQAWILNASREIGIGITNIYGWLLKQGIVYASEESWDKIDDFFKHYAYNVFKSSEKLAEEKGSAPAWDMIKNKESLMGSIYFKNIINEFYDGDHTKVKGLRNMAHMSIAPTGSISNTFPEAVAGSGVEPLIAGWYWRRTRAINKGTYTHYFVIAKKVMDYLIDIIDDPIDLEKIKSFPGSIQDEDGSIGKELVSIIEKYTPDKMFIPAHHINPMNKIEMMSRIYKWVDAAISVTYNLPETATKKDIADIYMTAFDKGVRAVSVYVDGSREGVLIFEDPISNTKKFKEKQINKDICTEETRPKEISLNCAPKRPEELPCDIHTTSIKGQPWTVLVGLLNDKPFEIFCGQNEDLYLPQSCKSGVIRKQGKGKYELEVMIRRSPVVFKDLAGVLMTDNERALTRILSLGMRHGVPPKYIVQQLKKTNGNITAFSTAISRVLTKYAENIALSENEKVCPVCGDVSLIMIEGCIKCVSEKCSYSKCG